MEKMGQCEAPAPSTALLSMPRVLSVLDATEVLHGSLSGRSYGQQRGVEQERTE